FRPRRLVVAGRGILAVVAVAHLVLRMLGWRNPVFALAAAGAGTRRGPASNIHRSPWRWRQFTDGSKGAYRDGPDVPAGRSETALFLGIQPLQCMCRHVVAQPCEQAV